MLKHLSWESLLKLLRRTTETYSSETCHTSLLHTSVSITSTRSIELTNHDRDINFVIMDYLINEGYPSAAQKFAKEANIVPSSDGAAIQDRVDIRNAIHAGEIQLAVERINELNPQVRR